MLISPILRGGQAVKKDNQTRFNLLWAAGILLIAVLITATVVLCLRPWESTENPDATQSGSKEELVCLQFSQYSGSYVEDGSYEKVTNVAAILVANVGTEFLDLATVTYAVGDETATFVVTGLPPGKKAWVLEANRMVLAEDVEFRLLSCDTSFRPDAVMQTELLDVSAEGNTLQVTNTSDTPLENVCVYYKVTHTDGHYLGGITYMLNFGTLQPGETVQKQSAHFSDAARIVRFSYQSE